MVRSTLTLREIPDDQLVREYVARGDQSAFVELYERYRRKVYAACRAFFHDVDAAEEATQEAFLRAFQNIDHFVSGDFVGWIMRIARNVCIDQWRRRHHEIDLGDNTESLLPSDASFERSATFHLIIREVYEQLKQLPAAQRRCIELIIDGYSYQEMAVLTGFTLPALKSHIQNGRRMLWQKLGKTLAELK